MGPSTNPPSNSDLDAQIQRCHERLEDNIMSHIFKDRLKGLMKQKDEEL